MKTKHLFALAIAGAALPLSSASAQYCDSYRGGFGHHYSHSSRSYHGDRYDNFHRGHHSYRHDNHRSHRSYGGHGRGCHACGSGERIRLIGGHQRGKGTRPRGWHDRNWFKRRGYNLDNYVHVHERSGIVHHGRNVRSRHRH